MNYLEINECTKNKDIELILWNFEKHYNNI